MFPKIVVSQNAWFIMENLIRMDDLGGKPTIFGNIHIHFIYVGMNHKKHTKTQKIRRLAGFERGASTCPGVGDLQKVINRESLDRER